MQLIQKKKRFALQSTHTRTHRKTEKTHAKGGSLNCGKIEMEKDPWEWANTDTYDIHVDADE